MQSEKSSQIAYKGVRSIIFYPVKIFFLLLLNEKFTPSRDLSRYDYYSVFIKVIQLFNDSYDPNKF